MVESNPQPSNASHDHAGREQFQPATTGGLATQIKAEAWRAAMLTIFCVLPLGVAGGLTHAWMTRPLVPQPPIDPHYISVAQPSDDVSEATSEAAPVIEAVENSRNRSDTPRDVSEALSLESAVREAVLRAVPATVAVQVAGGQGSGVLVSEDGLVLTAAHVSGRPGQMCQIVLADGRALTGVTLGANTRLDASMVRVTDPSAGKLPYVELGRSADLEPGSWTVATGHPGGYEASRPPVVRVGRINANRDDLLQSDNPLVGGDSGGPLFDLDGRLVGIHSRIGDSMASNIHVPVDRYVEQWGRLTGGEDFGQREVPQWMRIVEADDGVRLDFGDIPGTGNNGIDDGGVNNGRADDGRPGATVLQVLDEGPADGKLRPGDRIIRMGDFEIGSEAEVLARRPALKADEPLTYRVIRGVGESARTLDLEITPVAADSIPRSRRFRSGGMRPYRGVFGVTLDQQAVEGFGVRIETVQDRGPAREAGLQDGDIITALNGSTVNGSGFFSRQLQRFRGGDRISVRVRRPGGFDDGLEERTIPMTLANYADLYR